MRREIYGDGGKPEPIWNSVGRIVPVQAPHGEDRPSVVSVRYGRSGMVQPTGRVSGL